MIHEAVDENENGYNVVIVYQIVLQSKARLSFDKSNSIEEKNCAINF